MARIFQYLAVWRIVGDGPRSVTLGGQLNGFETFWGWRDQQLRDGTVIWTSPSSDTYVTTSGSALTGELIVPDVVLDDRYWERTAMMRTRRRTRAQNRAHRIAAERRQNQRAREARRERWEDAYFWNFPHVGVDDPPPF